MLLASAQSNSILIVGRQRHNASHHTEMRMPRTLFIACRRLLIGLIVFTIGAGRHCAQDPAASAAGPSKYLGAKFRYPGSEKFGVGLLAPNLENRWFVTTDDFGKVIKFYEKATGENLSVEVPGEVVMRATDRFLIDDSKHRPVQLRLFVHDAEQYSLTIAISRAQGENLTHIALVFRSKASKSQLDASDAGSPPAPFSNGSSARRLRLLCRPGR